MKEVQKEKIRKVPYTAYEAEDGTEFLSQSECEKYEKSAAAVIMLKLEKCLVAKDYNSEIFDCGDENQYKTIVPKTKEDIDNLNQLYFIFGGKCREEPLFSYDEISTPIIIGYRITDCYYDWVWFYKLNYVIKELTDGKYKLVEGEKAEDK